MRTTRWILLLAALSFPAWGQDAAEKKLKFNFKDASVDAVLQYVSSATGWIFVLEKKVSGTIDAVSDVEIPVSKCLDFLNAALRRHAAIIPNPYSPGLPKAGQVLKLQDVDEAKRRNVEIYSGANPDDIPVTDQVRTQILPLKAVNITDVSKELGEMIKAAVGVDGQVSYSTYSNSIVLTGRSDGINRVARVLRVIDVSASAELKIKVFALRNADATETAKTLNEVFKRETMRADTGRQDPLQNMMRMFGGGGGDRGGRGGGESGGPTPRALAHEMVRITAEARTNSVIVTATEDNLKVIEDLVAKLDDKGAAATKLKLYPLRYADATNAAKLVNDLFAETPTNSRDSRSGGGGGGRGNIPVWMGGVPQQTTGNSLSATQEVRAVPDIRTNSVLVAANEQKLAIIDDVVRELDRQVNDLLEVKVYRLQNADAVQMATVLQALFRPQIQATQNAGRSTGNQGNRGGTAGRALGFSGGTGASTGSGGLLPSEEVEITSDTRTRSVIVKASREYIAVMDQVVKDLDQDPTEAVSTYVIPLRNADASSLAVTLQNLLKGTSGTSTTGQNQQRQGQALFGGMQNNNQTGTQSGNRNTSGTRSGGGSGGTRSGGFLGPLPDQEEPAPLQDPQDPDEPRRGIEGQADIQADPTTNSLVVRTSPRNFRSIQALLTDLDRMRPQVLVKVLIADVTLDDRMQFGVEGFWENQMTTRKNDKATNRFGTDFPLATTGFSYLLTGDEFQASLNLLATEGKLKILATPRIMVLDNQTAQINIGKEVPRVTNSQVNDLGNTVNTVIYENIGIILDVTPHINPDGLVTMVVAPEISDVASEAESVEITPGVRSPTFTVNRASTSVAVRNGTTIAIGGLIREDQDETVNKIPFLGDIPLLGFLFSSTSTKKVKRELMIFLTPYVAFTAADLEEITQLEKSRLKVMDLRDIDSESDRWLERVRK
jgi:general secretion pathway protein D